MPVPYVCMPRPAHFEDADVLVEKLVVGPYENNVFVIRSKRSKKR